MGKRMEENRGTKAFTDLILNFKGLFPLVTV
jgi:hypothetical protein